jgi:excisionase family DNA binding protein
MAEVLPALMTGQEVMEYLGITRPTLRKIVLSGALAPRHVGGSIRFTVEDVAAFLDDCRQEEAEVAGE